MGSPDVPAWIAYLLVFAGGVITAVTNIRRSVGDQLGYWTFRRTWLLFLLYAFFPIVLFFFLDRLSAVHDTSIVAALLTGFGYQQAMTGGLSAISVPSGASQYWKPLQSLAVELADRISDDSAHKTLEFLRLIHKVLADEDALKKATAVAFEYSKDPSQLAADLEAASKLSQQAQPHVSTDALKSIEQRKRIEVVVRDLRRAEPLEWGKILKEAKLLGRVEYYRYVKQGDGKLAGMIAGLLLVAALGGSGYLFTQHRFQDAYFGWRLMKPNTTTWDKYRTWRYIAAHDESDHSLLARPFAYLESNALSPEIIDELFRVLSQSHEAPVASSLLESLIRGLRNSDPGVRLRVHERLTSELRHRQLTLSDSVLASYSPSDNETPADVNEVIRRWRLVLRDGESPERVATNSR